MSAYTTLRITRSKALELYHRCITKEPDDAELQGFLDRILADSLYNSRIVGDFEKNNDNDEIPYYRFQS